MDSHSFYRTPRLLFGTALLIFAAVAAACQSAPTAPAPTPFLPRPSLLTTPAPQSAPTSASLQRVDGTPGRTLNLQGHFAFVANDGNLSLQDAFTGEVHVLVKTSADGYAQSPAISPDGKQVAYSYNAFTKDGFVKSQLRVISIDGSDEHVLAAPEDMKIMLDFPTWSPDGKLIYVTQTYPIPPSDQHTEVDRISVMGGDLTPVVDGGYEVHISPDGKKLVYQKVDFKTYTAGLWVSNVDGTEPKQIMQNGAFAAIFGARFSPDQQTIVFAGSGPPKLKLPGLQSYAGQNPEAFLDSTSSDSCYWSLGFICLVNRAQAHGLPWDLWQVDPAGSKYERLTEIGADSPIPVWSADGKYIAFFEATGIYLLDREKKGIYKIAGEGGYGGFDWR